MDERELAPYRVGAMMYTPAISQGVAEKLRAGAYPCLSAMALCLEDSIADEALEEAQIQVKATLEEIAGSVPEDMRPLLFVRVRTPEHLREVHSLLGDAAGILTGYVLPKFDLSNIEGYIAAFREMNAGREKPLMMMPTLESGMVARAGTRIQALEDIRAALEPVREWVLNIRVGGNDFCNLYGLRRGVHQTIYDVGLVRDILVDVLGVFGGEYVVSGPVWEFFGEDPEGPWAQGLMREMEMDLLNGFIGKTAIHPAQLPLIRRGLQVTRADYEDALRILNWDSQGLAVGKSAGGDRMNEVKCHARWARRIVARKLVYGVREEE